MKGGRGEGEVAIVKEKCAELLRGGEGEVARR
jgi:hypothetical protein